MPSVHASSVADRASVATKAWTIYGYEHCPWCIRARGLLAGVHTWHPVAPGSSSAAAVKAAFGRSTMPVVLHGAKVVGGCDDLERLHVDKARRGGHGRSGRSGSGRSGSGAGISARSRSR
jgi:glutaredoxin